MKIADIAEKYGFDAREFDLFLYKIDAPKKGILQNVLDDSVVEHYVSLYQEKLTKEADKKAEQERELAKEKAENERKYKAMSEILISSGFSFEGYSIVKYSGYISGDDSIEISRESRNRLGYDICRALVIIRRQALAELKEAAYNLGCNAVIGVDFDYITMAPENGYGGNTNYEPYVICVTANGNAVVIEKK